MHLDPGAEAAFNGHVEGVEHPAKGDLRKMMSENPVPTIAPGTVDPATMEKGEPTKQALDVLSCLNTAIANNDSGRLESLFYPGQAYWKDLLSLTCHTRTFSTPSVIAEALLETARLRHLIDGFELDGDALFIPATPVLVSQSDLIIWEEFH